MSLLHPSRLALRAMSVRRVGRSLRGAEFKLLLYTPQTSLCTSRSAPQTGRENMCCACPCKAVRVALPSALNHR
eukprot:2056252-Amphidinium_carterae.2